MYYPFIVSLNKCAESCNTFDDQSDKMCVSDKISSDCNWRFEDKKNVIKNKIKINANLKLENH